MEGTEASFVLQSQQCDVGSAAGFPLSREECSKSSRPSACWTLQLRLKHRQTPVEQVQPWVISHPGRQGQRRWAKQGRRMGRHQGRGALQCCSLCCTPAKWWQQCRIGRRGGSGDLLQSTLRCAPAKQVFRMGRHEGRCSLQRSSLRCPPAPQGGHSGRHGGRGSLLQSTLRWAPASHRAPASQVTCACAGLLHANVAPLSHPCAGGASLVPAACRQSITVQPREQGTSCCACCMSVTSAWLHCG